MVFGHAVMLKNVGVRALIFVRELKQEGPWVEVLQDVTSLIFTCLGHLGIDLI